MGEFVGQQFNHFETGNLFWRLSKQWRPRTGHWIWANTVGLPEFLMNTV